MLINSALHHSQLKKEANSVAYHHVREGTALDEWRLAYFNTADNASDMMSKLLYEKRNNFCQMVLQFLKLYVGATEGEGNVAAVVSLMSFPVERIISIESAIKFLECNKPKRVDIILNITPMFMNHFLLADEIAVNTEIRQMVELNFEIARRLPSLRSVMRC